MSRRSCWLTWRLLLHRLMLRLQAARRAVACGRRRRAGLGRRVRGTGAAGLSLWWLLLLLVVVEEEEAGEGRDGWGVLWARQLHLQAGLAALALLLLRAQASCARLAAKEQATGSSAILKVWRWTTRATLS